jgi:hypothetical protein
LRDEGAGALPPEALEQIEALAEQYRFFHWHIEFPDVFPPSPSEGEGQGVRVGGFDVVLGNPPWEMVELKEREFFEFRDPRIARARNKTERERLIKKLKKDRPELEHEFLHAVRVSDCEKLYLRESGRYPLMARGRINTYMVFTELSRGLIADDGRVGIIVPSGVATDEPTQYFFKDIVQKGSLVSLYDFENREKLFSGIDSRMKFGLLILGGQKVSVPEIDFAFFLTRVDQLGDEDRCFSLTSEDLALINPNTQNCAVFRRRRDAELVKKVYRTCPVLVNDQTNQNPWGANVFRMFMTTSDSHLFIPVDALSRQGHTLQAGNVYVGDGEAFLPLYEGKMYYQFDHRFASILVDEARLTRQAQPESTELDQYRDPFYFPFPRYWVDASEVCAKLEGHWERRWLIGLKKVTSPTNERTVLATVLPWVAVNDSIPLLLVQDDVTAREVCGLIGDLNAFALDYVCRQKLGGINLNTFVIKQLPVLPSDRYTPDLLDFIAPRVVELTYTAWDLQPFARDVLAEVGPETWARWFKDAPIHTSPPPEWAAGPTPAPFVWNEERRAALRAELDGLYAHLYGLTRDELAYILDTFPIVRRKDEERWGEYRTKRMVLEKYDVLFEHF